MCWVPQVLDGSAMFARLIATLLILSIEQYEYDFSKLCFMDMDWIVYDIFSVDPKIKQLCYGNGTVKTTLYGVTG